MEFVYFPPPDDLDDCIGVACSIDMRSACHATVNGGESRSCHAALCGLRRFASQERRVWLDVSRRRLAYREKIVDLSEEEFYLLAAAASGRGHFVPLETVADLVFGLGNEEDGLAYVIRCIASVHLSLCSAGLPADILEVDPRAGVRFPEDLGD